jgi:DNA-binding MarR family transcriptional regulator
MVRTQRQPLIGEPFLAAWKEFLNAHAAVTDCIEAELASAGLPPLAWYDVLWALYRAPDRRLRIGDLAGQVVTIGRSGLSRLVDRIEGAGLLRREAASEDRRGSYAVLTAQGGRLLRKMWPVYAAGIERHFADQLSSEEAASLERILGRVNEAARSPGE